VLTGFLFDISKLIMKYMYYNFVIKLKNIITLLRTKKWVLRTHL